MKNYPPVTAFTLMYNTNPKYIIEAIESIRRNNYPNIEHIIMDDCSPDQDRVSVVEKWIKENHYECRFIRNKVNQGASKNINDIISLAKGKYLVGCCDDILADDRIMKDVELFETLPEDYALVFGFSQAIDSESNVLPVMSPNIPLVKDDNYFEELTKENFISGPAVTMRTDAIKAAGGYDPSVLVDDYDMWIRLAYAGFKFKVRPAILTYYRVLAGSLSSHPRLSLDVLRVKAKFPDRIHIRSMFDQEIQRALENNQDEKLQQIIVLYKDIIGSSKFIRLFELARFRALRSFLLSTKLTVGRTLLKLKA